MKKQVFDKMGKIIDVLLSLIYPERCAVCDAVIDYGVKGICNTCADKLKPINVRCYKCGREIYDDSKEYCADCVLAKHKFSKGYPLYVYNAEMKESIYRFKYGNRRRYATFFGKQMACELKNEIYSLKPDALIPVPMYKNKQNRRGYNQADLLAEEIGKNLNIPVIKDYIVRVRNTEPLKLLNPVQRQNNLKKAFKISRDDVKLNSIVIVDDIYTTGSTVDEISGILLDSGVKEVNFVALASGSNI